MFSLDGTFEVLLVEGYEDIYLLVTDFDETMYRYESATESPEVLQRTDCS